MSWPENEAALAKVIVSWLEVTNWDVYQEVQLYRGGAIADIVAIRPGVVWVVECKKTLGLDVIEQANEWRKIATGASVAAPIIKRRSKTCREFAIGVCEKFGIGVLIAESKDTCGYYCNRQIMETNFDAGRVSERSRPVSVAMSKRDADRWKQTLCEQHKTFAEAGNCEGRRWTPYTQTCAALKLFAEQNPGALLSEALAIVPTHYASKSGAMSSLQKWGESGGVRGVRFARDSRGVTIWPQ